MNVFAFQILPIFTLVIFVAGMWYRFSIWGKAPQPGKMVLFPKPEGSTAGAVIKASLFFPGPFKSNKLLWLYSWVFHATLGLIIVGHARVFADFPALWAALNINADKMSAASGGAAGVIILVAGVMLLLRRFGSKVMREITGFPDIFALLLILAVIITGDVMRFGEHFDLNITRAYFSQLLTLSFKNMVLPENTMFRLHFLLAQLMIIYIPFSKIMHFGGIFFTQNLIKDS
ncbi:respiratory nitrate reductase subunit gamma [bacterium]|nr:respiratory nitrate reductase subunit gamma [bacterium]